jgi:spore photoproduct lyase
MKFPIDEILIDSDAQEYPLTERVLKSAPKAKIKVGPQAAARLREISLSADPFKMGKRTLRLTKHRGAFVKKCPGTPEYVCCGLQILHFGQGCPMDCAYCALQVYFNRPVIEIFVNEDQMLHDLREHVNSHPGGFHRFCTGEFADSLALAPHTNQPERLVRAFEEFPNASLELKTKSDNVEGLLKLNPKGNVIVSFSVNSPAVMNSDEYLAAGLKSRLIAAKRAWDSGYWLGFHFDPIIPLAAWKDDYINTIDQIYSTVPKEAIIWISLGIMRFSPGLKQIAKNRFSEIAYYHLPYHRGLDGKSRLFVEKRIEVYKALAQAIRGHDPDARLYFCMESPYVWANALGLEMESDDALSQYLDRAFI